MVPQWRGAGRAMNGMTEDAQVSFRAGLDRAGTGCGKVMDGVHNAVRPRGQTRGHQQGKKYGS